MNSTSSPDSPSLPLAVVPASLTRRQTRDIGLLVLAFSCVVASLTVTVGTGAIVVQSVGGSTALAPFSLALFFVGMALVSAALTHWIFERWGRKWGLWVGPALGVVGSGLGVGGCQLGSSGLVLLSNLFLGGGAGIGMYLRFVAVEVVPPEFAAKAVTWTLGGGCLAAFVGPEAAQAAVGIFDPGKEELTYMGVYFVAAGFFVLQAIFVGFVQFPDQHRPTVRKALKKEETVPDDMEAADDDNNLPPSDTAEQPKLLDAPKIDDSTVTLWALLQQSNFLFPLAVAILSWIIMAMPMSIFRVVMAQVGFTARQSLTVIEFHFLSMYSPGFWSGKFIKQRGFVRGVQVAILLFLVAAIINLLTPDNTQTQATWYLGLIFLGMGWNFGFSTATIWTTQVYQTAPHLNAKIQAANECLMFLLSGGAIFSTGYLYNSTGEGGIAGWRILNYVVLSMVLLLAVLLLLASRVLAREVNVKHPKEAAAETDVVVAGRLVATGSIEHADHVILDEVQ